MTATLILRGTYAVMESGIKRHGKNTLYTYFGMQNKVPFFLKMADFDTLNQGSHLTRLRVQGPVIFLYWPFWTP